MDPDLLASLTWRDALLGLVAVLAVYVLVVFWRMRRLQAAAAAVVPAAQADAALAAYGEVAAVDTAMDGKRGAAAGKNGKAPSSAASRQPPATDAGLAAAAEGQAAPAFAWNEPPPRELADQRDIEAHERELARLRAQSAALNERVATLDATLNSLRAEMRSEIAAMREELRRDMVEVNAVQHVSPLYGEAMQMAMQGADASAISERCGIARAEAELVVALTRNRDDEGPR